MMLVSLSQLVTLPHDEIVTNAILSFMIYLQYDWYEGLEDFAFGYLHLNYSYKNTPDETHIVLHREYAQEDNRIGKFFGAFIFSIIELWMKKTVTTKKGSLYVYIWTQIYQNYHIPSCIP